MERSQALSACPRVEDVAILAFNASMAPPLAHPVCHPAPAREGQPSVPIASLPSMSRAFSALRGWQSTS
jgi:hypothetical protein